MPVLILPAVLLPELDRGQVEPVEFGLHFAMDAAAERVIGDRTIGGVDPEQELTTVGDQRAFPPVPATVPQVDPGQPVRVVRGLIDTGWVLVGASVAIVRRRGQLAAARR